MAKNKNKTSFEVEAAPVVSQPVVDFNVWFAMREKRIPAQHMREILWADFKARGLSARETVETYDQALAAYGIKL